MTLAERIAAGARELAIEVDADAIAKLEAYLHLIEKWNRVHNLTAVREPEQMVVLHVLDSLSVAPHVTGAHSLVDIGSGPGLPGIPLAIAIPGLAVTLLDSSHKKAAFLEQARAELALPNVSVVCERAEQWRPEARFDVVVSRAFADLSEFVSLAGHLLAPGGRMLAMKGIYPFEEIAKVPGTHRVSDVTELRVPELDAKRHLVIVERT